MEGKGKLLADMPVYADAVYLANDIWNAVHAWKFFEKDTVGKQLVRAIDSVAANIAEAYGRYHYGEKIKFYYYARGSIYESQYWLKQAYTRLLIDEKNKKETLTKLKSILKGVNAIIKTQKKYRSRKSK